MYYSFIIDEMISQVGWNGFAGRSFESPDLGLG